MAVVVMASGCGRGTNTGEARQAVQALDLSEDARKVAVIEAATLHFNQTVRDTFLVQKRMTVRSLARSATAVPRKWAKTPVPFHASRYDPTVSSSAKLELIDGKVIYTAVAAADDASAAVISDGKARWLVAYEIEAQLTPQGELTSFVFHQLGEPRRGSVD